MDDVRQRLRKAEVLPASERLDPLMELHREAKEALTHLGQEIRTLRNSPGQATQLKRREEGLALAEVMKKEIEAALARATEQIAAERTAARQVPMSAGDHALLGRARAYVAALERADRAARELAEALRDALHAGASATAGRGNDRLFMLGNFRERATAGLVRLFELDPTATGTWGNAQALLELGPAKNRQDIARVGLLAYEREGLRSMLPPHVGAAL